MVGHGSAFFTRLQWGKKGAAFIFGAIYHRLGVVGVVLAVLADFLNCGLVRVVVVYHARCALPVKQKGVVLVRLRNLCLGSRALLSNNCFGDVLKLFNFGR